MSQFTTYDPARLPGSVLAYLDARDAAHFDEAANLFTPDAIVEDDGRTYRGAGEIHEWIAQSTTEFDYTATRLSQCEDDAARFAVKVRLDGNFPGGTVTLTYQFQIGARGIERLAIGV